MENDSTVILDRSGMSTEMDTYVLEAYTDSPERFFPDWAEKRIREWNSTRSLDTFVNTEDVLIYDTDEFNRRGAVAQMKVTDLHVFLVVQKLTAERRWRTQDPAPRFEVSEVQTALDTRIGKRQTRRKLDTLEAAGLLICSTAGSAHDYRLAEQDVAPVFERAVREKSVRIETFEQGDRATISTGLGLWSFEGCSVLLRSLFWNERRTGIYLLGLFIASTLVYLTYLLEGYPFVATTPIHYLLTALGLAGGWAIVIGSLRETFRRMVRRKEIGRTPR